LNEDVTTVKATKGRMMRVARRRRMVLSMWGDVEFLKR